MRSRCAVFLIVLVLGGPVVEEELLYNRIGTLTGQVFMAADYPSGDRTPFPGAYFVLQRVGCSECLIGVQADIDGKYWIPIGIGKYRIYTNATNERDGLLHERQVREASVGPPPFETVFDIEFKPTSTAAKEHKRRYNLIGTLTGEVSFLYDATRISGSGEYFALQRTNCHRCLVGVHADGLGKYEVFVGVGEYRIYSTDPHDANEDLLHAHQARRVAVKPPPAETVFDIELTPPKVD